MKALIQRVSEARVETENHILSNINKGILLFVCVEKGDTDRDIEYVLKKIINLRIFEDVHRKMNLSIKDISGEILVVPQFTLSADCRKGNRPSFEKAEEPGRAHEMFLRLVEKLKLEKIVLSTGRFASYMHVHLVNDGPVTILIDSQKSPAPLKGL